MPPATPRFVQRSDIPGVYLYAQPISALDREAGITQRQVVPMFYQGAKDGEHAVSLTGRDGRIFFCKIPCRAIRQEDRSQPITRTEAFPNVPGSILHDVFSDIENGFLTPAFR